MVNSKEFEPEKYQLLHRLVHEVQTRNNQIQQQESAINQIAVTLLRSRPLCRRFNGTPLTGVYQEIYNRAKENLIAHLRKYLIVTSKKEQLASKLLIEQVQPTYLFALQKQIFQQLLNDTQLKKMSLTAQKYSINSELRTYALTELIRAIELSGRLCRPHVRKFSPDLYKTLYEEALAETLAYVCLNIDLYDPNRGSGKFMNWVNFKLDKLILKSYERFQRYARYELPSLSDLEQIGQPQNTPDLAQILREYLTQDPDNIFATVYIRNRPEANFSNIALAKFSGRSWEEISRQLNIPIPTLSSFYNRWCRRFAPLLKTELNKFI